MFALPENHEVFPLEFRSLGSPPALRKVFTLGWRFIDAEAEDPWSKRFTEMKYGTRQQQRAAVATLSRAFRPRNPPPTGVVIPLFPSRAANLVKGDLTHDLAHALAVSLRMTFNAPGLVRHAPHEPIKFMPTPDRRAILQEAYSVDLEKAHEVEGKSVVLVDDFVTAGTSMQVVADLLWNMDPRPAGVWGVCIAKNERRSYAASQGCALSNDHIPVEYAEIWDRWVRHDPDD